MEKYLEDNEVYTDDMENLPVRYPANMKGAPFMRKSTRAIAEEMGLQPISVWTALKMLLKGYKPGLCWGYRTKKGVRAWRTK